MLNISPSVFATKLRVIFASAIQFYALLIFTKSFDASAVSTLILLIALGSISSTATQIGFPQSLLWHRNNGGIPYFKKSFHPLSIYLIQSIFLNLISTLIILISKNQFLESIDPWIIFYFLLSTQLFYSSLSLAQGTENFKIANIITVVHSLLFLLTTCLLIYFNIRPISQLIFYIGCTYLASSLLLFTFSYKLFFIFYSSTRASNIKTFYLYGIHITTNNFLSMLNYKLLFVASSFYWEPRLVASFGLALTIAEKVWISSNSINFILYPLACKTNNPEKLKILFKRYLSANIIISVAAAIILITLSFWANSFYYEKPYVHLELITIILLVGTIFAGCTKILATFLASTNRQNLSTKALILISLPLMTANSLIIAKLSPFASIFVYSLSAVILFFYLFQKVSLNRS